MNFIEIAGLGSYLKDPEEFRALIEMVDTSGEELYGYSGWYGTKNLNGVDCIMHVAKNEIIGFSFHMRDENRWKLFVAGTEEFSPPPHDRLSRGLYFTAGGSDRKKIPVMLIKSDVLPSLIPGDEVEMQVAAAALSVSYYPDEKTWIKKNNLSSMGEMFGLAGNIIGWADGASIIKGTVKSFTSWENAGTGGKEKTVTCRCLVETGYGDIAIYHTQGMVDKEGRPFMKEGACVLAQCIIQGDVAVGSCAKGAEYNEENILRLMRDCFYNSDFTRARSAFAQKAEFIDADLKEIRSESTPKTLKILQQMADTAAEKEEPFCAYPAKVTGYFGKGEDSLTGRRVLALARETPAYFRELIYLDLNSKNKITAVSIKNIDDYMVEIDEREHLKGSAEDCLTLLRNCLNSRNCSRLLNYLDYNAKYSDSEEFCCEGCYEVLDALEGLFGYGDDEDINLKAFLVKLDEGTEQEKMGVGVSFNDYDECSGVIFLAAEGGRIKSIDFIENDFILEGLEDDGERLPADALDGGREWLNFLKRWADGKKVEPMDIYVAMDSSCRLAVDDGKVIDVIRDRDAVFGKLKEIAAGAVHAEIKGDRLYAEGFCLTVKTDLQGRITLFKITLLNNENKGEGQ